MHQTDLVLRLLQFVGLALPALALYIVALTELHMAVERATGVQFDVEKEYGDGSKKGKFKPDPFTARLTTAWQEYDFAIALISLILFLLSTIPLLSYFIVENHLVPKIAIILMGLAILSMITAIGKTLQTSLDHIRN